MEVVYDEKVGFWLRPGTLDRMIVGESRRSYLSVLDIGPEDRILDVGACFGAFTKPARALGAFVVAVEPHPQNFELLGWNSPSENNFHGAAVGNAVGCEPGSRVTLYVSGGINTGLHSIHPTRGRQPVEVNALNFSNLLAAHEINKVKLDCEGAEHDLLSASLPQQVTHLALEWHLNRFNWRESARKLHQQLVASGFSVLREPRFGDKNWTTLGAYRR